MTADDPIRASDADREVVVAALRDAYTAGRLTMEEFDERTSAAYAARTWGELRKLTVDLPAQPILGADVPGRRWSPAQLEDGQSPAQLPSHPPRHNLPPRLPRRSSGRPVVMLVPLAIWLLLIARSDDSTVGPIVLVVTIMLLVAVLSAVRRRLSRSTCECS